MCGGVTGGGVPHQRRTHLPAFRHAEVGWQNKRHELDVRRFLVKGAEPNDSNTHAHPITTHTPNASTHAPPLQQ